jgi:hypothetical protein
VIVPLRAGPTFAAVDTDTVALPLPDAALVSVIHAALLAAVHEHQLPIASVVVVAPPSALTVCAAGEMAAAHDAASWETVTVCPAIVPEPVRAGPLLAAAVRVTVPDPVPDDPLETLSHGSLVDAAHEQ